MRKIHIAKFNRAAANVQVTRLGHIDQFMRLMARDKKAKAGKLTLILARGIGEALARRLLAGRCERNVLLSTPETNGEANRAWHEQREARFYPPPGSPS